MEPKDWNIVVRGSWNPAILTPSGVSKRLFELPDGTPLEVQIPLNGISPYLIRHNNIVVQSTTAQLIVAPTTCDYKNLYSASEIACRALQKLRETPVTAAGFNIRFQVGEYPTELVNYLKMDLDDRLSKEKFSIVSREIKRTLKRDPGTINLEVEINEDQKISVVLNFHLNSTEPDELVKWLTFSKDTVEADVKKVLGALGLDQEKKG